MLLCVSSAPLGWPVVPLVYRMTAVSVSLVGAEANAGGWRWVNSASVSVPGWGEVAPGSAVSRTKCSQVLVLSNAARPAWAMGSSGVPSKQT